MSHQHANVAQTPSPKQTATKSLSEMINSSEMSSPTGKGETTTPLSPKHLLYSKLHSARASSGGGPDTNYVDKDDMDILVANNVPPSPLDGGYRIKSQQNENSYPVSTNTIRQSSQKNKPPLIVPIPMARRTYPPSSPARNTQSPARNDTQLSPSSRKVLEKIAHSLKAPTSPMSSQEQQRDDPAPSRTPPRKKDEKNRILRTGSPVQRKQQLPALPAGNKSRDHAWHKQQEEQDIEPLKEEVLVQGQLARRASGGFGDRYSEAIRVKREKKKSSIQEPVGLKSSTIESDASALLVSNDDTPLISNCEPDRPKVKPDPPTNDQIDEGNSFLDALDNGTVHSPRKRHVDPSPMKDNMKIVWKENTMSSAPTPRKRETSLLAPTPDDRSKGDRVLLRNDISSLCGANPLLTRDSSMPPRPQPTASTSMVRSQSTQHLNIEYDSPQGEEATSIVIFSNTLACGGIGDNMTFDQALEQQVNKSVVDGSTLLIQPLHSEPTLSEEKDETNTFCDVQEQSSILCGSRKMSVEPTPPKDDIGLKSPSTEVPVIPNTPNEAESLDAEDLTSMQLPDTKVSVKKLPDKDKDVSHLEGTKAPSSAARGPSRPNIFCGAYTSPTDYVMTPPSVMVNPSYNDSELDSPESPSIARYCGRAKDERIPHSPLIVAGSLEAVLRHTRSGHWEPPEIIAATESAVHAKSGQDDHSSSSDDNSWYQEGPSFDETSPDASKSYTTPKNIGWGIFFRETEPTPSPTTKQEVSEEEHESSSACGTDSEASKTTFCCQRFWWRRLAIVALVLLIVVIITVYMTTSSAKSSSSDRSTPFIEEQVQGTPPPMVPDPVDTYSPTAESLTLSPVDTTYSPTPVPIGSPTRQSTQEGNDTASPVSSSRPASEPSSSPSASPSLPAGEPSSSSSTSPALPTSEPSSSPSASPSLRPSASPSFEPTISPSLTPSEPSSSPSSSSSSSSSSSPSLRPSASPSFEPSSEPMWDMEVLDEATVNNLDISYEWIHGNNNLELEIQSSLESKWQGFLDVSIRDWNNSQALVLTSNQTAYESTCRLEVGKFKICNADYGTTDWRGITTVLLEGKQIIASAIKLNDFYSATDALNQYDVCHQLGHAFGLRHSEGDNCMASLTSWNRWSPPEHPDQSNLDELVELYKQATPTRQRDLEFRHQLRGRSPEGAKEHRVEVHKV